MRMIYVIFYPIYPVENISFNSISNILSIQINTTDSDCDRTSFDKIETVRKNAG